MGSSQESVSENLIVENNIEQGAVHLQAVDAIIQKA
jgi:hypothetical protein